MLLGLSVVGPPRTKGLSSGAAWLVLGLAAAWVAPAVGPPRADHARVVEVRLGAPPLDDRAPVRPASVLSVWEPGRAAARWDGEVAVRLRMAPRRLAGLGQGARVRLRGRFVLDRAGTTVLRADRTPAVVVGRAGMGRLVTGLHHLRRRVRRGLGSVGARSHGLFVALVLGDRSGLDPSVRQAFARTGTAHLLAISGLHVGLCWALATTAARWGLARLSARLLRRGVVRGVAGMIGWSVAASYVLVAGAPVSGLRALAMLAVVSLAGLSWRRASPWNVLAAAALVVVAADPGAPRALGFQLSVASVAFLLAWTPLTSRRGLTQGIRTSAIGGALGTLATAPLVAAVWGQVPLAGLWANAVAVPLLGGLLVPLVLLGAVLGAVDPALGGAVWPMAEAVSWLGLSLVEWLAEPSRAPLVPWSPRWPLVVAFYGFAGLAASRWRAR